MSILYLGFIIFIFMLLLIITSLIAGLLDDLVDNINEFIRKEEGEDEED